MPRAYALCRHCRTTKVTRPRGLCWHCYNLPGVRDLYPVGARPNPADTTEAKRLPTPTPAPQGTEAKVAELEQRVQRGEQLWHPDDNLGEE